MRLTILLEDEEGTRTRQVCLETELRRIARNSRERIFRKARVAVFLMESITLFHKITLIEIEKIIASCSKSGHRREMILISKELMTY